MSFGENLIKYSEQFDNAAWDNVNGVTVTPDFTTSPIGDTTADRLVAAAGDRFIGQMYVLVTGGAQYTFSVYMKADSPQTIGLYMHGWADSQPEYAPTFSVTTSWQRFSATFTMGAADTTVLCGIGAYGHFNGQTIYAWGAQVNSGATAQDYTVIPRKVIADVGAFAETGIAARLLYARKLSAAAGAFAETGIAAALKYARKLIAATGTFVLTGMAAILRKTGFVQGTFPIAVAEPLWPTALAAIGPPTVRAEGASWWVTGAEAE